MAQFVAFAQLLHDCQYVTWLVNASKLANIELNSAVRLNRTHATPTRINHAMPPTSTLLLQWLSNQSPAPIACKNEGFYAMIESAS